MTARRDVHFGRAHIILHYFAFWRCLHAGGGVVVQNDTKGTQHITTTISKRNYTQEITTRKIQVDTIKINKDEDPNGYEIYLVINHMLV